MDDFQRSRLSDVRPEPEADISSDGRSSHGYGDVLSLLRMPDGSHYDLQEECWGNASGDASGNASCNVLGDAVASVARVPSPLRLRRASTTRDVPAGDQQPLLQRQNSAGYTTNSQSQHLQDVGASLAQGGDAAENRVTSGSTPICAVTTHAPAMEVPLATSTTAAPRLRLQEARAAAWASRQERAGLPQGGGGIQGFCSAPLSPPVSSPTVGSPPGSNNSRSSSHSDSMFLDFLREHGHRQADVTSPPSRMGFAESGTFSTESSALMSEASAYVARHVLPASTASSASCEARADVRDDEELPTEHRDEEEGLPEHMRHRQPCHSAAAAVAAAAESRSAAVQHRALPYGYSGRPHPRNERPPLYDPGTPAGRQHHASASELATAGTSHASCPVGWNTRGHIASTATSTIGPLAQQHGVPETPARETAEADVPLIACRDGEWEVPVVIQAEAALHHPEPSPAEVLPLPRARLPVDTEPGQTWLPGNSPERWRNSLRPRFSDTMSLGVMPTTTVVSAAETSTGPEGGEEERSSLIDIRQHLLPHVAGVGQHDTSELQDATQQVEGVEETSATVVQMSRRNSRVSWVSGASLPLVLGDFAPAPRAETPPAATESQTQVEPRRPGHSRTAGQIQEHASAAPWHSPADATGSASPPLLLPAPAPALPLEAAEVAAPATITPARRHTSRTSIGRASEMTEFLSCEEMRSGTAENQASMPPPPHPPLAHSGTVGSHEGRIHAATPLPVQPEPSLPMQLSTPASWGELVLEDVATSGAVQPDQLLPQAASTEEGRQPPQGPQTEGLMPPPRFHLEGNPGVTLATDAPQHEPPQHQLPQQPQLLQQLQQQQHQVPTACGPRTEGPLPHISQQEPLQHEQPQQHRQQLQQQTSRFGPPASGHSSPEIPQSMQLGHGDGCWQPQQQQQPRYGPRTEGPLPHPDIPQSAQLGPGDSCWQQLNAQPQQLHRQPPPAFGRQPEELMRPVQQQVNQHSNAHAGGLRNLQPQLQRQQQQQHQHQHQMGPRTEGPLPPPERLPPTNAFGVGQTSWAAVDDAGPTPASWASYGNVGDISQIPVAPRRMMHDSFVHDPPFMPPATETIFNNPPPFRPHALLPPQQQLLQQQHGFPMRSQLPVCHNSSSGFVPQSQNADFQRPGTIPQMHTNDFQFDANNGAGLDARQFWGPQTEGPMPPPVHTTSYATQQPHQSMVRLPNMGLAEMAQAAMPEHTAEVASVAGRQRRRVRHVWRRMRRRRPMRPPPPPAAPLTGPGQVNAGSQIASGSGDSEPCGSHDEREEPQASVRSEPLGQEEQLTPRPLEQPEQNDVQAPRPPRRQEREEPQSSGPSELVRREEQRVLQPLEHPEQNEAQELQPAGQQEWGEPTASEREEPQAAGGSERVGLERQRVPRPSEHLQQDGTQVLRDHAWLEQVEQVEQVEPPQDAYIMEPMEPVPPALLQAATRRVEGLEVATQSEQPDGRAQVSRLPEAVAAPFEVTKTPLAGGAVRGEAVASRAIVAIEVKETTPPKLPARTQRPRLKPPKAESFELTEVGLERFGSKGSARRSTRRIVQPLKHWLDEKVLYERKAHSLLPTVVAVQLAKPLEKKVEDVCPQLLALCDAKPLSPLQNLELPEDSPVSQQQYLLSPPLPPPPLRPSSPSEPRTPMVAAPGQAAKRVPTASARSGGCSALKRHPASVHTQARPSRGGVVQRQSSGVGTVDSQSVGVASSDDTEEAGSVRKASRRGAAVVAVECVPADPARGSKPTNRGHQRGGSRSRSRSSATPSVCSASRPFTDSDVAKTPAASIRSGSSETGSKRPRSHSRAPSRPQKMSDHSMSSGLPRGQMDHKASSSQTRAKRRRLDHDSDAPSEAEASVPLADGFEKLADGFVRAPPAEGSLQGCEIRVGTHAETLMCVDLLIPPRSHSRPEIVCGGKTLQMYVQRAGRGALFAQLDGHHLGLNANDNLIVRSGQEYCLRNNSEIEIARLKMVLITNPST